MKTYSSSTDRESHNAGSIISNCLVGPVVAALAMILSLCWQMQAAPPQYSVTVLGTLGGGTSAFGINNAGQVVGSSNTLNGRFYAVVWGAGGGVTNLGTLSGFADSRAIAINESGQITGTAFYPSTDPNFQARAFRYSEGSMTNLGTLGGANYSEGRAINDSGTAVGRTLGNSNLAFQSTSGQQMTQISGLLEAQDISNLGTIAGQQGITINSQVAATKSGTTITTLGTLGGSNSWANGINDSGQVVGYSEISGNSATRAFLYSANTMHDLGTLGGANSTAISINEDGLIVGRSNTSGSHSSTVRGFLYVEGAMHDLASLISGPSSFTILYANDIKDWGQIAAIGENATLSSRALLLTPASPVTNAKIASNGITRIARLFPSMSYSSLPVTTNPASGGLGSSAAFLGGIAGSSGSGQFGTKRKVTVTLSNTADNRLASDLLEVSGTEADQVCVQLSYDETAAVAAFGSEGNARLGWLDSGSAQWNLAVNSNTGGTAHFAGDRPYNAASDFQLGTYGVDTASNTVWAVINHNSQFGVIGTGSAAPSQLFSQSAASSGLTGNNALPNAMPFGDGVPNLIKYAFNMNLAGPDASVLTPATGTGGLPATGVQGSGAAGIYRMEFLRRVGSGLVYSPQKTSNLADPGSWTALSDSPTVVPVNATWERVIYEEPLDFVASPKSFLRVQVVIPN